MPAKPIPDPRQPLAPYLIVKDAARAIAFYVSAFGATEKYRLTEPSGKIGQAELDLGGGLFMIADEYPDFGALSPPTIGGTPVTLHLYVADVDAMVARAEQAGATVLRPLTDEFFGDRVAMLVDPFGHKWHLATHKEDVTRPRCSAGWTPRMREPIVLGPDEGRRYAMGRITSVFKADDEETAKAYSISEWWLEPDTTGPGAHSHPEDDVFYVLAGTMSFLVGDRWIDAGPGSFVLVPGGMRHDFENRGTVRAGVLNFSSGVFEPAMPSIVEYFAEHPPGPTSR